MTASYDDDNIFAKILRGEIPADVIFEDDHCLAFRDVAPQAPVHVLVIPKARLARLSDASDDDRNLLGHLFWAAGEVARLEGLPTEGFRVVVNDGPRAGQAVPHLHLHVLGGRDLSWPPG